MISVNELRNGSFYEDQGQLLQVLSYEHIKMGRGSATIKLKVKNVRSGSTTEKSFVNSAKVNDVSVPKKQLQYLYKDEEATYFMDPVTYDQVSIPLRVIEYESKFLKEGAEYPVSFYGDEPLSILLPPKMDLKVTDTGPNVKGNSATNIYKDAVLENGLTTKVPLFIKIGDAVRIDTRTGEYTEKANPA
jgi:elongation factor P